jgi:putative ABC transport system permease protein
MKFEKSFELALNILFHSRLRSWLTIIGIIIGIGAVVSIVSISQGAQEQLEGRLGDLGADILTISPGFSRAQGFGGGFRMERGSEESSSSTQKNLTSKDIIVLKNLENVLVVMGQVSTKGDLTYSSKTASVSVSGVEISSWEKITTEEIASG